MSATTVFKFPMGKLQYFWLVAPSQWSLEDFSFWVTTNSSLGVFDQDSTNINYIFYNLLHLLESDSFVLPDIQNTVSNLMKQKRKSKNANKYKSSPPLPTSTSSTTAITTITTTRKRKMDNIMEISLPLPRNSDSSLNILKILELTIPELDAEIISQGSTRSYKSSKHLYVDSKRAVPVFRESVYDAEMYRVLVSWLKLFHDIEITGQWHLEKIGDDGDLHHSYCDLTLKHATENKPVAILELLATASRPILDKHFLQILSYAQKLQPSELWVIHFSREDNLVAKPHWPSKKLQQKGLNVVHFWHD
ncbi:hypothetical protein RhiirA5_438576 [Rhizophagus irregularis]|uniref:Uncharacterized protein n=1 Tax=Rhizophagus irregularis TaxID=588596 RepID=A0A2N0NIX5_9GLOM|nr:hypothetical protein RhiirA5_438576 [Rhizophagus irregularis]